MSYLLKLQFDQVLSLDALAGGSFTPVQPQSSDSSHSVSKVGLGRQVQKPRCWETGQWWLALKLLFSSRSAQTLTDPT